MNLQPLRTGKETVSIPPSKIQSCLPKHDLKGHSVAIIGLGKSGISAARLALARGASVLAIDQNENLGPLEAFNGLINAQENITDFEKHGRLKTILGSFDNELLKEADTIVVSPGVPLESYGLLSLLQSGKRVMSELDFAAEVIPRRIKILAVTGTNGKSTVATFAGQMLDHLDIKIFVGGNLGVPLSEAAYQCLMSPLRPFQVAVVEVSSYQLEIPNKYFHPSVSMILNLTPDHLERHKTMRNYAMTKCRLLSNMNGHKIGILPLGNPCLNEAISEHKSEFNVAWIGGNPGVKIDMEAKVANFDLPIIRCASQIQLGEMKTIGSHNYHNAAVAALSVIGLDIGINAAAISSIIGKLRTPSHRMQIVHRDTQGITWVDDSKATNAEATYTGLVGLKGLKSVILLGGITKVRDVNGPNGFEQLVKPLNDHRGVITFGSSGMMIEKTLTANGLTVPCQRAQNLKDAVSMAKSVAQNGDAIVLSPGCASFDEFRNFEHRGKVFQELALLS
ncbi:hypothetical protein ACH5RR_007388 [Cinchona calisaya]|uniref:UDP-N-acetylmuramoyl-L-alanyl-D-glutamate synthetase n=1 Tax=Cinchona calisaya TaxID=153742 RepID=A0ABD3ARN0_9GENT